MTARYTVISADCHGGSDIVGYRPYLEARHLDEFDAWRAAFDNPYDDLRDENASRNWDSERRLAELEADGIVAEVIFPNTIPPFFPTPSLLNQPPPANAGDLDLRWAGLHAHNRWLADFCARTRRHRRSSRRRCLPRRRRRPMTAGIRAPYRRRRPARP